ncbi:MAG: hypothetical protein ACP5NV_04320 [Candidatus Woesearchaeota archaeon]
MDRYKEIDFDVMEAIQCAPGRGLYFVDIAKINPDTARIFRVLKKLKARNFLTETNGINGAYFCIKENNIEMNIRRVQCPICKTVRRTHRTDQVAIHCSNAECKSPSGRHRTFWLVNIDHLRKGSMRRINCVN